MTSLLTRPIDQAPQTRPGRRRPPRPLVLLGRSAVSRRAGPPAGLPGRPASSAGSSPTPAPTAPRATGSGSGALGWLMAHGSGVHVEGVAITAVPLGVTAVAASCVAARAPRRRLGLRPRPDADRIADGIATGRSPPPPPSSRPATSPSWSSPAAWQRRPRRLRRWSALLVWDRAAVRPRRRHGDRGRLGPRGDLDVVPAGLAAGRGGRRLAHARLVRGLSAWCSPWPSWSLGRRGRRDVPAAHQPRGGHPAGRSVRLLLPNAALFAGS